ncbi:GNAT family N-acetyltransferase [Mycolicibacterium sp. Y3]
MPEAHPVPTDQHSDTPRIVPLFDGRATVTLRKLTSADFDRVVELADGLSDDEKYLRFFTARPAFIPQWAASLTEPAGDVVALGAFDHGELVGVANYTRCEVPDQAEVAVVVARYQHDRGVGTALLGELVRLAKRDGFRHLVADVLAENHRVRRVIADSHLPVTLHRDGSILDVDVDLNVIPQDE